MKKPMVSIIMNCHNGGIFLRQSITSILNQSYENWELIFYDNCSSDNSKQIIEKFKDNRIKYFKSKFFLNLYHARNNAIKKAKGKYIAFLDTDDWWKKNKLQEQIKFLKKNKNVKILYTNCYIYHQNTKTKKLLLNKLYSGMIASELLKNYFITILTVIVKKDVFKNNKFDKRYNIIGDFDFFSRLSLKYPIYCIEKPLAYFRAHNNNYSILKKNDYISELKFWIKKNNIRFKRKKINMFHPWITIKKLQIKNLFNIE